MTGSSVGSTNQISPDLTHHLAYETVDTCNRLSLPQGRNQKQEKLQAILDLSSARPFGTCFYLNTLPHGLA
ncbi:unnamed protein product [Protopolystoma xenopodis]|uniref:Uncharacterized protein n=1 Tax=Protopolystoma xenopodis TaxID=117903 RepID=A0A3S5FEG8_9PLAT|nr:unnamed protein product [Protopolystoma xenopodis]